MTALELLTHPIFLIVAFLAVVAAVSLAVA